eukprot:57702_1
MPTTLPTLPTANPSNAPSGIPSIMPSYSSYSPSNIPSTVPTFRPSAQTNHPASAQITTEQCSHDAILELNFKIRIGILQNYDDDEMKLVLQNAFRNMIMEFVGMWNDLWCVGVCWVESSAWNRRLLEGYTLNIGVEFIFNNALHLLIEMLDEDEMVTRLAQHIRSEALSNGLIENESDIYQVRIASVASTTQHSDSDDKESSSDSKTVDLDLWSFNVWLWIFVVGVVVFILCLALCVLCIYRKVKIIENKQEPSIALSPVQRFHGNEKGVFALPEPRHDEEEKQEIDMEQTGQMWIFRERE